MCLLARQGFVSYDSDLACYMEKISKIPMLSIEEEQDLAKRWSIHGDLQAAHSIVASYLRLVVKIALKFRHYGMPIMDLVSEGNIGLMKAVKNFDVTLGYRVSTYALWWIKAAIQEYIVRSWSVIRIGSSSARRRLFFGLRRVKRRILGATGRKFLSDAEVDEIACDLKVSSKEVVEMDSLLTNEPLALDAKVSSGRSTDADSYAELQDMIPSDEPNQECMLIEAQENKNLREAIKKSLNMLDPRCRDIFIRRRLAQNTSTLEDLSKCYKVSKERIRQIEKQAEAKMKKSLIDFCSYFHYPAKFLPDTVAG